LCNRFEDQIDYEKCKDAWEELSGSGDAYIEDY
jgi:hypothetical protein